MMDEQEFKLRADEALAGLHRALVKAADRYEFEPDFNAGALSVEFEDPPARFVISPNAPVRQVWVSAHSRSYKLEWDQASETFVLGASGQTLKQLMEEALSSQIGEEIKL